MRIFDCTSLVASLSAVALVFAATAHAQRQGDESCLSDLERSQYRNRLERIASEFDTRPLVREMQQAFDAAGYARERLLNCRKEQSSVFGQLAGKSCSAEMAEYDRWALKYNSLESYIETMTKTAAAQVQLAQLSLRACR